MIALLVVLIGIIAVLLILAVLLQNPKGGGLDSTFGGGSANQMFGASRSGDVLEKVTWVLAGSLIVLSIITTIIVKAQGGGADVIDTKTGLDMIFFAL